jgi:type I restriction enzyme M protein
MLASMAPSSGRVAVVLPQGALFRPGAEAKIRRWVLERDYVEAVIGLASNLFYGTGLAACILVLRATKPEERAGKVLVANAETLFRKGRNQNSLEPEHADKIYELYTAFTDELGLAHVANLEEIASHNYNLSIPLYVPPAVNDGDTLSLEEALTALKEAHQAARISREALEHQLDGWGLL